MKRRIIALFLCAIPLLTSCRKTPSLRSDIAQFVASFSLNEARKTYLESGYERVDISYEQDKTIRAIETLDFNIKDLENISYSYSYKVYEILCEKVKNCSIDIKVSEETLIIIGLLHDLCKVNFYKIDYRNAKNERGEWEKVPYYTVEDTIPYGHGEKSVMMITEYIKLSSEEKYAIRWHMGFSEPKETYGTLGQAWKKYPLGLLLNEADLEATYFYGI